MGSHRQTRTPGPGPVVRKATLLRPFGYVDADGVHHHWRIGEVVDPEALADLEARGAALDIVTHTGGE